MGKTNVHRNYKVGEYIFKTLIEVSPHYLIL